MNPFAKLGERQGYFVHWHWYIDRIADLTIAQGRGHITVSELDRLRLYYEALWIHGCATA